MCRVTCVRDLTHLGAGNAAPEIHRMRDEGAIERSCDEQHRNVEARQVVEQRRLRAWPQAAQACCERASVVVQALAALRRDELAAEPLLRREERLRKPFVDECFDSIRLDSTGQCFVSAATSSQVRFCQRTGSLTMRLPC